VAVSSCPSRSAHARSSSALAVERTLEVCAAGNSFGAAKGHEHACATVQECTSEVRPGRLHVTRASTLHLRRLATVLSLRCKAAIGPVLM